MLINVVVCKEEGRFCGWPANNGMWSYGNEILVCFTKGFHLFTQVNTHTIDRSRPSQTTLARSLDGGETWMQEPFIIDLALSAPVDFSHPDLALRVAGGAWQHSYNRGKSWSEPLPLPDFNGAKLMCRTDYQIIGKNSCILFICSAKTNGEEGRVFAVKTGDGGISWSFCSYIGEEPEGYSIMPASAVLSDGSIFVANRCANPLRDICWIDGYRSTDGGKSFAFCSTPVKFTGFCGNPPALVHMNDGRLCLVYGFRNKPYGLRAVLSADGGRTWRRDMMLRTDGGCWDLGYTRAVQRPDGKIVAVYYYNDSPEGERYIAATIFDPNEQETVEESYNRGFRLPPEWI